MSDDGTVAEIVHSVNWLDVIDKHLAEEHCTHSFEDLAKEVNEMEGKTK